MSTPFNQPQQNPFDHNGMPAQPQQQYQPQQQPQYGMPQYGYQQQPQYVQQPTQQRSWVATMLLCFFFGTLGVHNFYLGYTSKGIVQLALTIIGWITAFIIIGFAILALVGIWVLVDLVLILTRSGNMGQDSRGVPLN